jgi:hypothetical protein
MANSKKKCKFKPCSNYVKVGDAIQFCGKIFCSEHCKTEFVIALYSKKHKDKVKAIVKKDKQILADRKEAVKPKSKWLAELQAVFNKYVRLRDINDGCISCDKTKDWQGQWHAGHYFSRGHSSSLRFNLNNVHKSCSVCNNHLSGNIGEYTPRLIEKIGIDAFNYLEAHKSDVVSYDVDWIKRAIKITKKAIKRLEKRISV